MKMQKETMVVALLAVLVLIAAVQAFQLVSLSGKAPTGGISFSVGGNPSSGKAGISGGNPNQPTVNLQDLPNMVGGC
jgi:hypothetical protein